MNDIEKTLLYWSGDLTPDEAAEFEASLANSSERQAQLQELRSLQQDMGAIPEMMPDRDLVSAAIKETYGPPKSSVFDWFRPQRLAIALGVAVVGVVSLHFYQNETVYKSPEKQEIAVVSTRQLDQQLAEMRARMQQLKTTGFALSRSAPSGKHRNKFKRLTYKVRSYQI